MRPWAVPTAPRRAAELWREGGPRAIGQGLLRALGVRRVVLFERRLEELPPQPSPDAPVILDVMGEDELDAYLALRGEDHRDRLERRLAAGDVCHVARANGRIVAAEWISWHELRMRYLRLERPLAGEEAYLYDGFTEPEWRRRGILRAVRHRAAAHARSEGCRRALSGVLPENRAGLGVVSSTTRAVATLVTVRIGPWHRHLRLPPPRALR